MVITLFKIELQVRDHECDIQGIVNNAVYQHYFEHARHEFLKTEGLNFLELTQSGIILVLYRVEIDYLLPLKASSKFHVDVRCQRLSKFKCLFHQTISIDDQIYTKGQFFVAAINTEKKPINLDQINIEKFISPL